MCALLLTAGYLCCAAECMTLEVKAQDRVFLFLAESSSDMQTWVKQISLGREVSVVMCELIVSVAD